MKTSKRIFRSALALFCSVLFLSLAIIEPSLYVESAYYQDGSLRRELAGTIDYEIIGASHSARAFVPTLLDEELGCRSYNLSQAGMTSYGRRVILEKELDRNPVKTVVVELSSDTLIRQETEEAAPGDAITYSRLDSPLERIEYLVKYVTVNDWVNIYSRLLRTSVQFWRRLITRGRLSVFDPESKGFVFRENTDVTLSKKKARKTYNSKTLNTDYLPDSVEAMTELIALCREHDAQVILVVCPISDRAIWQTDGWDRFLSWAEAYCAEQDCPLYDLNLLRSRYEVFSDAECYFDATHLSGVGGYAFTRAYIDLMKRVDAGEDVSSLFYDTYEDMKADSPYWKYMD